MSLARYDTYVWQPDVTLSTVMGVEAPRYPVNGSKWARSFALCAFSTVVEWPSVHNLCWRPREKTSAWAIHRYQNVPIHLPDIYSNRTTVVGHSLRCVVAERQSMRPGQTPVILGRLLITLGVGPPPPKFTLKLCSFGQILNAQSVGLAKARNVPG